MVRRRNIKASHYPAITISRHALGRTKLVYIAKASRSYAEQATEEIVARLNPTTREVENLEVLFFSTRLLRGDLFELPIHADLRLVREPLAHR